MNITKTTRTFEGTLSNGRDFTLDIIKRGPEWLLGIHTGSTNFFTTSKDFAFTHCDAEVGTKVLLDLRVLGIPDEDAKIFVDALGELVSGV